MNNNYKRISIKVYGKVQGVFFRASTQEKAQELGLTGFVQNEPDGTVYLEAEGDPETIKQLEAWAHQGPERARVEKVEVQELDSLVGFEKLERVESRFGFLPFLFYSGGRCFYSLELSIKENNTSGIVNSNNMRNLIQLLDRTNKITHSYTYSFQLAPQDAQDDKKVTL